MENEVAFRSKMETTLRQEIAQKERNIASRAQTESILRQELANRDHEVTSHLKTEDILQRKLADHQAELRSICRSVSWRVTAPFRFIGKVVLQLFWYATDTSPGHALVLGWQILRSLSLDPLKGPTTQEQDDCRILNESGLFDVDWYLKQYLGLRPSRRDPVLHYLRYGAAQGLNPSPLFDARDYLFSNPDVAAANINPLLHYALHGRLEGRKGGVLSERRQVTPIKEVARSIETISASQFRSISLQPHLRKPQVWQSYAIYSTRN